jgi:hypothetical protein
LIRSITSDHCHGFVASLGWLSDSCMARSATVSLVVVLAPDINSGVP